MSWVLVRELDVRAAHPASHEGARYEGPALPLLILLAPLGMHCITPRGAEGLLVLGLALYAGYVAYAAARLGAGAVVLDGKCLRHLPASPWEIFWGKAVGSLAPLVLEILVATPVLWTMASACRLTSLPAYLLLLPGLLLWHGLWGTLCSATSSSLAAALASARKGTHLSMVLGPLLALALQGATGGWAAWVLNPPLAIALGCGGHPDLRGIAGPLLGLTVGGLTGMAALAVTAIAERRS